MLLPRRVRCPIMTRQPWQPRLRFGPRRRTEHRESERAMPIRNAAILLTWACAAIAPTAAVAQPAPDSIVAEGVPEVPRELEQSLARYQNSRAAQFQGWYSDRRELLITTRFGA